MLGFVRDKLVKLVKTEEGQKYLRRLDELHKIYILFSFVNIKKNIETWLTI